MILEKSGHQGQEGEGGGEGEGEEEERERGGADKAGAAGVSHDSPRTPNVHI